jgi:hypothetical protein
MPPEPMNGYGLIASIVQSTASLAWPGAFVCIVWLFREKLLELLPLLHFRHNDTEAYFRRAEKEAAKICQSVPRVQTPPPTPEEQKRLTEISPRKALLELRRELEIALRNAATRLRILEPENVSMITLIRVPREIGKIDPHTSALLEELRQLGNSAILHPRIDRRSCGEVSLSVC